MVNVCTVGLVFADEFIPRSLIAPFPVQQYRGYEKNKDANT